MAKKGKLQLSYTTEYEISNKILNIYTDVIGSENIIYVNLESSTHSTGYNGENYMEDENITENDFKVYIGKTLEEVITSYKRNLYVNDTETWITPLADI